MMRSRHRAALGGLASLGVVAIAAAVVVSRPGAPVPASVAALVPGAREMAATRTSVPWLPTRLVTLLCRADDRSIVSVFEPVGLPLEMLRPYAGATIPPPFSVPDPAVGIVGLTEAEFQAWLAEKPSAPHASEGRGPQGGALTEPRDDPAD